MSARTLSRSRTPASLGLVASLRMGDRARVERVLADAHALGVKSLRVGVSWAEHDTAEGAAWYGWLLPRLASELEVVPCVRYTPTYHGVQPRLSAPPRDPKLYADFLDVFVTSFGDRFEWVELWDEPNNLFEWDCRLDPDWMTFCKMLGGAAYWMKQRGKKTLLGGMSPIDPNWLRMMFDRGVMQYIDAVGLHGFPGTREPSWNGWPAEVARVVEVLEQHESNAEIWISETGYSTWRHDERGQLRTFLDSMSAPVSRIYWHELDDLDPSEAGTSGHHTDEREYHFGLKRADGSPKLLYRLWRDEGIEGVRDLYRASAPARALHGRERPIVLTGGAGFIGSNLAARFLRDGHAVRLVDNLSRPGVERNVRWLKRTFGDQVQLELADVRDRIALRRALADADAVFHFAAQVAVTTSLEAPDADAAVNLTGTLGLLEELRAQRSPPPLFFTSTNKVYGALEDVSLVAQGGRWEPLDATVRSRGISEARRLDFHSPYGCSKGAADQYVLDWARSYGLRTVVFRMSCIYGPRQLGTEDQGWVAHFLARALRGEPITIYGDGRQVRDALYVDDLVEAFLAAHAHLDRTAGQAFNVGGGPANTTSLLQLIDEIADLEGREPEIEIDERWRVGDQRWYVSDFDKLTATTGWRPRVDLREGLRRLHAWLREEHSAARAARRAAG